MPERATLGGKVRQLLLSIEAKLALFSAQLLISFVPFRLWSWDAHRNIAVVGSQLDPATLRRARGVGRRIDRTADRSFVNFKCLARAIAAWRLLRRRKIPAKLLLGARRDSRVVNRFELHAWVVVDDVIVVGKDNGTTYSSFSQAG